MIEHYVLPPGSHTPRRARSRDEFYALNFSDPNQRIVKQEVVCHCFVSTVFLGFDHSFGRGEPQLFETMIFTAHPWMLALDCYDQWRCARWDQAIAQHNRATAYVRDVWDRERRRGLRPLTTLLGS